MKIQNKKTKTTIIISALAIGLVLLSPTTVLPSISAQTPIKPSQAMQFEQQIAEQIKIHRGWVGVMSWDSTGATIHYLGPAAKNPYHRGVEASVCNPPSWLRWFII